MNKSTYELALNAVKGSSTNIIKKHTFNSSSVEIKKFNEEQMIAIEPLYCKPLDSDAHEQGMTETEIRKMVDNINTNIDKISGNIAHVFNTDGFYFVKAWVNECDCMIGNQFVPEGQPIIAVQFTDKTLWDMRKTGQLQGLSIGARGHVVDNPEYQEAK
ncbi:XkdF-like putative serine protease domain-containing protein [Aeromonas allosaccharophila]|uniref:XkdF-like putative serine protease domain-containing protein n=1 Tax=Aeromonas allosaccharophila TaxID=656 RepID=UPI0036D83891